MGNRYTNEGRDPRSIYDDSRGRDPRGRRRYGDTAGRSYPSFRDRSSYGGEHYFGSGQMGFGDGIEDYEPNRSFGSSWRDSTGNSNYRTPEQRYDSTRRRAGFGRDAYGLGYGGDWEPEANRRRYEGRHPGRERYEDNYAGLRADYSDYPSSESGFYDSDRDRRRDERSWWDRAADEVSSWFGGERDHSDSGRYQSYRGRGPKNYTRSDDRIREDINDRLTDHDYLDASYIEAAVENGEVTLSGNVRSRYEKRMAEDIVEDVSGVKNVENRIRIGSGQSDIPGTMGYEQVTGHGELNRQEVAAAHDPDLDGTTSDRSRSASGNR